MSLIRFARAFRLVSENPSISMLQKKLPTRALLFGVPGCNLSTSNSNSCKESQLLSSSTLVPSTKIVTTSTNLPVQNRCLAINSGSSLIQATKLNQQRTMTTNAARKTVHTKEITKNLTLYTDKAKDYDFDPKTLKLKTPSGKPLVIIMAWLLAKPKHISTYAQLYTNLGFDVLNVQLTPWQLLWPVKGAQLVAADALKFIENNTPNFPHIVIHGFSVGAYQFGELMAVMVKDLPRYQPFLDKVSCQIWDSAADITEIPVGVPKAIFPKNMRLQTALRNYVLYHLKAFHNQATVHYMRSSHMFHFTLVKAPALFFVSKNDSIGPPQSNMGVINDWRPVGIKVTYKCWDHSGHVCHLIHHREEYLSYLYTHLEENNAIASSVKEEFQRARAKL